MNGMNLVQSPDRLRLFISFEKYTSERLKNKSNLIFETSALEYENMCMDKNGLIGVLKNIVATQIPYDPIQDQLLIININVLPVFIRAHAVGRA